MRAIRRSGSFACVLGQIPQRRSMVEFRPFPQTYVFGWRLHHGLLGCVFAVIGAALAAHDRHDFPWPLRDSLYLGR
jgi:hypothetical protein